MKRKSAWVAQNVDLLGLALLCIAAALLARFGPPSPARVGLAMLCMFFAPGYSLLAVLYPSSDSLSAPQRVSVAVVLSVMVVGLLSLATAYLLSGLTQGSALTITAGWTIVMLHLAGYRRWSTTAAPPAAVRILQDAWSRRGDTVRALKDIRLGHESTATWRLIWWAVVLLLVLSAGRLLWITNRATPQFAELYVLGENGEAAAYPEAGSVGEWVTVTVGIVHHGDAQAYDLLYRIDEGPYTLIRRVDLKDGENWQADVRILPEETGSAQQVTFALRRSGDETPCRTVHIWLDVRGE